MFGFDVEVFKPEHVKIDALRKEEQDLLRSLPDYRQALLETAQRGPAWTIFSNGKFVSCGGVVSMNQHLAEVWQLPSQVVRDHMVSYGKFYSNFLDRIVTRFEWRRYQTVCVNDELHVRWMTFLKFEKEGVLRGYGSAGEDYAMFGRLKDGLR